LEKHYLQTLSSVPGEEMRRQGGAIHALLKHSFPEWKIEIADLDEHFYEISDQLQAGYMDLA
jgi:hypothetical protein